MIAIGDVHGCYKTLRALIQKLPEHSEIVFTGDVIDRGRNSKEIIDLIIENDYKMVLGNHEDMLLQFLETEGTIDNYLIYAWWAGNGGDRTIASFDTELRDYEDFFKELPLYIEYESIDGKNFIISHSCLTDVWDSQDAKELFREKVLWSINRHVPSVLDEDTFNVIGHLIQPEPVIGNDTISIDTGCWGDSKGKLTAYDMDTGKFYQQNNIE